MHRAGKMGLGTAYISGFKHFLGQGAEAVASLAAARVEQGLAGAEPEPVEIDGEQHV